jgi:hypothetical protein
MTHDDRLTEDLPQEQVSPPKPRTITEDLPQEESACPKPQTLTESL